MDERAGPRGTKRRLGWQIFKAALIGLGVLVVGAVVAVASIVTSHSTDCYGYFHSAKDATWVLAKAHGLGLEDTHLNAHRRWAAISISSGETGNDAQEFRRTVRVLVRAGGGHVNKKSPCIERPYFN